jgi:hypothetical protein
VKLSARLDLELPREQVFAAASDFAAAEERLTARGVQLQRTADRVPPAPGMTWAARAPFRGRLRDVAAELVAYSPPDGFAILSRIGGMTAAFEVRLVALAPARTRVIVGIDLRAQTLKARVILSALRLGKSRAEDRLARGLAAWGAGVVAERQRRRGSAG